MTHIEVPLNRLKFGQEDGAGINARVAGRLDGIEALAANLHANGQIEDLIVKKFDDTFFTVSNGNRRLAAFHMIYGPESTQPIGCTLHDVDEKRAFEFSLITAVTAAQLHPVDQYEGFTKLRERGKTDDEIAHQYGMTPKQVRQALALGALSPKVRDAWRSGMIDTYAAQAFTLAADHTEQDKLFEKLKVESDENGGEIAAGEIEHELKVDPNGIGHLLHFVGIEAYEKNKGKVLTRDLFGTNHKVSDEKLLKKLANDKLAHACEQLVKKDGWSFAAPENSVRNRWEYGRTKVEPESTPEEDARLAELARIIGDDDNLMLSEMSPAQREAWTESERIRGDVIARAFTPAMRAKAGCFVEIGHSGELKIEYGRIKPAQKQEAAKVEREEEKKKVVARAVAEGKPPPVSTTLSNALKQRLEAQLIQATRDAIAAEAGGTSSSPLTEILAGVVCKQIVPERPFSMPDAVRTKLPSIRQVLSKSAFNPAIAKRFDAEDYFSSAPKVLVLKAIAEAVNADEARKLSGKTKVDIWKFALANLSKTGWLPKELRTVHYAGPGSEGYKPPSVAAAAVTASASTAKASTASALAKPEAKPSDRKKKPPRKAATAKKAAKKAAAKKRKAG